MGITRIQIHATGAKGLEAGFNSILGKEMMSCCETALHSECVAKGLCSLRPLVVMYCHVCNGVIVVVGFVEGE